MKTIFGLIMILSFLPIMIIMYFMIYTKDWKKKKVVFGVLNREEFKSGDALSKVDALTIAKRKEATYILAGICFICILLFFIPSGTIMMIAYSIFVFVALIVFHIPYVKGNTELKSLKRELGIEAKGGIRQADLKSINASHALNLPILILPLIFSVAELAFSFLYDMNYISIGKNAYQGNYIMTILSGTFLFMGLIFILVAVMMDKTRNEVISADSDINANYNRAKKKVWADIWVALLWVNVIFVLGFILAFALDVIEMASIAGFGIYIIVMFIVIAMFGKKISRLNGVYEFESPLTDDDDNWLFGLIYYNPNDKKLNVEKRNGLGTTVNFAHPGGKVLMWVLILLMVETFAGFTYAFVVDSTDMHLRLDGSEIVCHQLRDEVKINTSDIKELSFGDTLKDIKMVRLGGVGTENVLKGNFSVGDDKKCKVFLSPVADCYIRIVTEDKVYYLSATSREETKELYSEIK